MTSFTKIYLFSATVICTVALVCLIVIHAASLYFSDIAILTRFNWVLIAITVMVGMIASSFVNEGNWKLQIANCPLWMKRSVYAVGMYAIILALIQLFALPKVTPSEQIFVFSGGALALNMLSLCIFSSLVIKGEYNDLANRAVISFATVIVMTILFMGYRLLFVSPK